MKLGDRMKEYEYVTRSYLPKRLPIIIRIDGKAFHTFAKGFVKPYDKMLHDTMIATTKYLVENIQGCVLGYTQSDEISLLLLNNQSLNTEAWMKNNLSKILSLSASMATFEFNRKFKELYQQFCIDVQQEVDDNKKLELENMRIVYAKSLEAGALFDSRVFVLPNETEVINYFIWRQEDASKNSVQMLAQSVYSHTELQNLHTGALQDKLFTEKGINWNDVTTCFKRGSACYRKQMSIQIDENNSVLRRKVIIDNEIPIFKDDRDFIIDLMQNE